jgi:iron-sulfur cluster repair protein YtfE (RIC family)
MRITDALRGEHGVFYAQFDRLEQTLDTYALALIQAQGALLAAGLAPHAHIENDVLFPVLENHLGEEGPTRVFRMEHEEIEAKLQELKELQGMHDEIEGALARLPQLDDVGEARRLVREALYAAREHFAKEENMLFPMAEQILDERTLKALGAQWAERRSVVLA